MKAGVYCIKNQSTNDFYVGSSVNLKGRWWKYLNHLRRQIHKNPKLQNVKIKLGKTWRHIKR